MYDILVQVHYRQSSEVTIIGPSGLLMSDINMAIHVELFSSTGSPNVMFSHI